MLTGSAVPGSMVSVRVDGPVGSTVLLARALAPAYIQTPLGVVLIELSGPHVSGGVVGPNGSWIYTSGPLPFLIAGIEFDLQAAVLTPSGQWQFSNRTRVIYEGLPQSLQIAPIGTQTVQVGSTLHFNVATSGAQNPPVLAVKSPFPLLPNMSFDAATGEFSFSPDLSQVGTIPIEFMACDNFEMTTTQTMIVVQGPPPGSPTALSGKVYNASTQNPIPNVTVMAPGGTPNTTTAADGSFLLSGLPSGSTTIIFNGQTAGDYPFLPEPMTLIAGVTNVIERPVFLPLIGTPTGTPYSPMSTAPTPIQPPSMPGLMLTVMPGSVRTPQGQPYTGNITIAPVPPSNAPLGLPPGVNPNRLISIQPGGLTFNPPATITWPNDDNYQPGTVLNIWSVDGQSGQFATNATVTVQPGGTIQSNGVGITVASWHYLLPAASTGPSNQEGSDPRSDMKCGNSMIETASGALHETYTTPSYQSVGVNRATTLHYNSQSADVRPVVLFDVTIPQISTVPQRISTCAVIGGVAGPESFVDTTSLSENQNETVRVSAQLPIVGASTGVYDYTVEIANHFAVSTVSSFVSNQAAVLSRRESEIGVGWAVESMDRLYPQPDGKVLLTRGDGSTMVYRPGNSSNGGLLMRMYDSPSPYVSVQNQFLGLNPGNFTYSTAGVTNQLASSLVVPVVNFPDGNYDQGAFYNVGPNNVAEGPSATAPLGDDISIQPPGGNDTFGASFVGYVNLPAGGNVTFGINVDDAFALYVNNQLVLSNFGGCNYCSFSTTVNNLPMGYVPIRLDFAEDGGEADIVLLGSGGGLPGGVIPANFLSVFPASSVGMQFLSPDNDTSTLIIKPNGTYTRVLKDLTRIEFNAQGMQTAIVDRNGNSTTFGYDAMQRLTSITDPVGQISPSIGQTTFIYTGTLLSEIRYPGPSGLRSTLLTHDADGNLTRITEPDGGIVEFTYDAAGRMVTQTNKSGNVTTYEFDYAGRIAATSRSDGSATSLIPTGARFLVNPMTGAGTATAPIPAIRSADLHAFYTDGSGRVYRTRMDTFGRPTREVDPLGRATLIERNTIGLPTKITEPNSSVTRYVYDFKGNATQITEEGTNGPGADDRTWTLTYDPITNQVLTIVDPKGNLNSTGVTTRITYDAFGRPSSIRDAADTVTQFAYDEAGFGTTGLTGLLTRVTAAAGQPEQAVTRYAYDAAGRLQEITDPVGRKTAFTFDSQGSVATVTAKGNSASTADDQTTSYSYNLMNQVTSITDALNGVTSLAYWPDGNLREVQDAKPTPGITSYLYDPRGRVAQRTDPLGRSEFYLYDGEGRLVQHIDRAGQLFNWLYDQGGRLIQKSYPSVNGGVETATFTYETNTDNLVTAVDADSALTFTWNGFGELASASTAGSPLQPNTLITYGYDKNGNRTSMVGTEVGQAPFTSITYVNDNLDRLQSLTDTAIGATATFTYDRLSRRRVLNRTFPGHISRSCYDYNAAGDLLQIDHRYNPGANCGQGTLISRFAYTYNALGLRDTMTEDRPAFGLMNNVHTYTYDALNRLISATHPVDPNETFTYDAVGNRLTSGPSTFVWQYNLADQLLNDGASTYTYDLNGNRATRTSPSTGQIESYVYDSNNRLQTFINGSSTIIYYYDASNRRIAFAENGSSQFSIYDGADAVLGGQSASRRPVTFGAGLDSPLFFGTTPGTTIPFCDAMGSIVEELVSSGSLGRATRYSAYGASVASTGPVQTSNIGFSAREYETGSGLLYLRTRHYDASVGRFIQQDSVGFSGGGTNLYEYVGGNPVSFIDPTGEFATLAIGALIGIGIELGSQLYRGGGSFNCLNAQDLLTSAALGAVGGGFGGRGLQAGLKGLSNQTKGKIGEGLSIGYNYLKGSTRLPIKRIEGQTTIVDSAWRSITGATYYVESKFGTARLTNAQRRAAGALGDSYHVERWGYPFFERAGGVVGGGATSVPFSSSSSGNCGCQ